MNVPDGADLALHRNAPGVQRYCNVFDRRTDPRGKVYYWLCGVPVLDGPDEETSTPQRSGAVSLRHTASC